MCVCDLGVSVTSVSRKGIVGVCRCVCVCVCLGKHELKIKSEKDDPGSWMERSHGQSEEWKRIQDGEEGSMRGDQGRDRWNSPSFSPGSDLFHD